MSAPLLDVLAERLAGRRCERTLRFESAPCSPCRAEARADLVAIFAGVEPSEDAIEAVRAALIDWREERGCDLPPRVLNAAVQVSRAYLCAEFTP